MSAIKQSFRSNTAKRLFKLLKPQRILLIKGMIALILGSSVNLIFPEIFRHILDQDYNYYLKDIPYYTALFLIGIFAMQAVFFYYRSLFFGLIGQNVVNDLRKNMFSSIISQEVDFFDRTKTGDLISALSSDAVLIQDAISVKLSVFIRYSFQVIVGIILMFLLSQTMTGLIVISVPLLIFISRSLGKKLKYWSKLQQQYLGKGSGIASESFTNIRIVKAYNREEAETGRFHNIMSKVLEAGINRTKISGFFSSFVSFLMNALLVLLLFYGFQRVSSNQMTFGDLTAFVMYGVIVAVSFAFVVSGYSEFVQSLSASERIFEFLDTTAKKENILTDQFVASFSPEIKLENVTFSYKSRPDYKALDNINLSIEAGKITAIVGPSGAGKSTIVNLILKFYLPESGIIKVSGTDIKDISKSELRNRIAYVPQEPQLFDLSIEHNLKYAKPDATQDEVNEVCVNTNLLEFIRGLPAGFQTEIGERGVQLSAGQKQRLAIARAMLRKPDILILDEATASLDSQNEYLVQQALEKLMLGKTTLVIAHRLSTVKAADKLVVLENGRIIQSGTHDSLSSVQGLYRDFVQKQELSAG